jgi:hypothetical protein
MNVVPIQAGFCKETVAVLEHLLARARSGTCRGVAVCSDLQGQDKVVFTGKYRRSPAQGVNAAMRISVRLAQLQEDIEAANHT